MAEDLCDLGLMEKYTYGADEFRITSKGRAALASLSTNASNTGE
jgi:predicted transcriptional regulator